MRCNIYIYILRSNNNTSKAPETGEWVCGVGVGVRRGWKITPEVTADVDICGRCQDVVSAQS